MQFAEWTTVNNVEWGKMRQIAPSQWNDTEFMYVNIGGKI
jgi:hypothetical protein